MHSTNIHIDLLNLEAYPEHIQILGNFLMHKRGECKAEIPLLIKKRQNYNNAKENIYVHDSNTSFSLSHSIQVHKEEAIFRFYVIANAKKDPKIRRVLGEGGFGKAYLAYEISLQEENGIFNVEINKKDKLVMKKITNPDKAQASNLDIADQEASTTQMAKHEAGIIKNITYLDGKYLGSKNKTIQLRNHPSTRDYNAHYISMKRIKGKSLYDYISLKQLSMVDRFELALDLLKNVDHIHQQGLLHCDIKPENIIADKKRKHAKPIDFGLSVPVKIDAKRVCGTPDYMSPETMLMGEASKKTDIYSTHAVLAEMFGLGFNHSSIDTNQNNYMWKLYESIIVNGKLAQKPLEFDSEIYEIIKAGLDQESDLRPDINTTVDLLSRKYFAYLRQNGQQDLCEACKKGDIYTLKILLDRGVTPNSTVIDEYGKIWSALAYAVGYGKPEIVKLLLEYNVDVNQKEASDGTPLLYTALSCAFICHKMDSVKMLLKRSAEIDFSIGDREGKNILEYSVDKNDIEAASLIINKIDTSQFLKMELKQSTKQWLFDNIPLNEKVKLRHEHEKLEECRIKTSHELRKIARKRSFNNFYPFMPKSFTAEDKENLRYCEDFANNKKISIDLNEITEIHNKLSLNSEGIPKIIVKFDEEAQKQLFSSAGLDSVKFAGATFVSTFSYGLALNSIAIGATAAVGAGVAVASGGSIATGVVGTLATLATSATGISASLGISAFSTLASCIGVFGAAAVLSAGALIAVAVVSAVIVGSAYLIYQRYKSSEFEKNKEYSNQNRMQNSTHILMPKPGSDQSQRDISISAEPS